MFFSSDLRRSRFASLSEKTPKQFGYVHIPCAAWEAFAFDLASPSLLVSVTLSFELATSVHSSDDQLNQGVCHDLDANKVRQHL